MAWSKRIVLLIGTGLAAGALFAGVTTRSIRSSFGDHSERVATGSSSDRPDAEPSWLERGFAVINGPAWPFGQHAWDPEPDDDSPQDTLLPRHAPYPSDERDYADRADDLAFHDSYTPDSREASLAQQGNAYDQEQAPAADEAAQAAARAGDAARDVIAAEKGN